MPYKHQNHDQLIDVASSCFQLNEEYYGAYPKGDREKRIYFNTGSTCPFLIEPRKNVESASAYYHNYLYKYSNRNFPEQFWVEIFAYRFGCLIGIEVPPAFVAIDRTSENGLTKCGAFIEWMYAPDDKGRPHMKWEPGGSRIPFESFISKLLNWYPSIRTDILAKLNFKLEDVNSILEELLWFDVPTRLTPERAEMMFKLISLRQKRLCKIIECV